MRIRTIKPEFWAHPVMARMDDATKLLAIGLLNYADDEGYFYAEAAMVRAALRPLDEDSTSVRESLVKLEAIGFIERVQHPTHGPLGRVVSFKSHQRVDRPSESKVRVIWCEAAPVDDSSSVRRAFDEQSPLERKGTGKGTGNRERSVGAAGAAPCTLDEAKAFAETIGLAASDTEAWFDHFASNGWKVSGKTAMKDWQASMRTWQRNIPKFAPTNRHQQNGQRNNLPMAQPSHKGPDQHLL